MSVTELQQQIVEHEASINAQQLAFEAQRKQIVEAIKPFIKDQLRSEVENNVRINSEHTKKLGKDSLFEMKKRLTELLEDSDRIVDETFSDDLIWTYMNYRLSTDEDNWMQGYNNVKKARENILYGIRTILGYAGKILADYKYITIGRQYVFDINTHNDFRQAVSGKSKIIYKYAPSLSQNINALLNEYCKNIDKLHSTAEELSALKKAYSEQEAIDLWNEF